MALQIIKQPNGKLMLFSSVTDGVAAYNLEKEDVVNYMLQEAKLDIEDKVDSILNRIEQGKRPYHVFTVSYDEAMTMQKRSGGKKLASEIKEATIK